jgi:site-specific recombinase XerD
VYSARLRLYFEWCRSRKIDPHSAPVTQIADFLKSRFDTGLQPATVRGYLSPVLSIYKHSEELKVDPVLKLLIEGMHITRPGVRRVLAQMGFTHGISEA